MATGLNIKGKDERSVSSFLNKKSLKIWILIMIVLEFGNYKNMMIHILIMIALEFRNYKIQILKKKTLFIPGQMV